MKDVPPTEEKTKLRIWCYAWDLRVLLGLFLVLFLLNILDCVGLIVVPNVAPKHCRPTLFLSDFLVLILPVLSLWTRVCSNGYFLFWIKYLLLAAIAVMVVCLCAFDSNPFADPRMQFEFFVDFVSCIVSCVFIHGVMCCVDIIVRIGEIREMLLCGYVTRKRTNFTYRKVTAAVLSCFYLWLFFYYSRSFH